MKYVVITSKHHDSFSMFDTKASDYDIVNATPIYATLMACPQYSRKILCSRKGNPIFFPLLL